MLSAFILYSILMQIARGRISLLRSLTREIMARERKLTSSAGRKANFFAEEWGKVRNFRFTSTGKVCYTVPRYSKQSFNPSTRGWKGTQRTDRNRAACARPRGQTEYAKHCAFSCGIRRERRFLFGKIPLICPKARGENQQREKEEDSDDDEHAGRHSESPADGG